MANRVVLAELDCLPTTDYLKANLDITYLLVRSAGYTVIFDKESIDENIKPTIN